MKPARIAALMLLAAGAAGADTADEAGLKLADETPAETSAAKNVTLSVEPAWVWATARAGGRTEPAQRLALDLAVQATIAPGWRLVAADRLDLNGPARLAGERWSVNTLKELYAGGRIGTETLVDLGRVNARFGVATGYNPTDYLRDHAVRSPTSINPASLRENRLGTVMLRGQRLWNGGSFTAIAAPRLADAPNSAPLAVDIGATNHRTRWIAAWSQALAEDFAPQLLLHGDGESHGSPQVGLNLTRLLSSACVGHAEWSGGRSASLLARARRQAGEDVAFRSRLAAGLTCVNAHNLSVTAELQRNGAALDTAGWRALREGPLPDYLAYRHEAALRQDPPTRDGLFVSVRWQNALPQLDLAGFTRLNLADHSRLAWLEARTRWRRADLALQWQAHDGDALSEYGGLPHKRIWQLLLKVFF
jgi:hypothetical protein